MEEFQRDFVTAGAAASTIGHVKPKKLLNQRYINKYELYYDLKKLPSGFATICAAAGFQHDPNKYDQPGYISWSLDHLAQYILYCKDQGVAQSDLKEIAVVIGGYAIACCIYLLNKYPEGVKYFR